MDEYAFVIEEQRPHHSSSLFFNVNEIFSDPYMCKHAFARHISMYPDIIWRITVRNDNTGLQQEYLRYENGVLEPNIMFSKSNIDRKEISDENTNAR